MFFKRLGQVSFFSCKPSLVACVPPVPASTLAFTTQCCDHTPLCLIYLLGWKSLEGRDQASILITTFYPV